jgi:DNA-binding response OmpR family regulator
MSNQSDKFRILIVDDEEDIRTVIRQTLNRKYEVVEAHDGLDAVEKLDAVEPDLVVMDVMMPLMDGYKACEAIRRKPDFQQTPVLFLSALNSKDDIKKGYQMGGNLYLTKPFDPLRLMKNIDFHFENHQSEPRPKKHPEDKLRDLLISPFPHLKKESQPETTEPPRSPIDPVDTDPEIEKPVKLKTADTPVQCDGTEESERARLMLVDDDSEIRLVLDQGLSGQFEVVQAADGIEAIERIVEYEPDLIMIDALMPRMSGYQLCQSLRKNRRFQKTPIVFLSGKSTAKDVAYAKRLGASDFISKPFELDDVRQKLIEQTQRSDFVIYPKRISIQELHAHDERKEVQKRMRESQRQLKGGGSEQNRETTREKLQDFLKDAKE